MGAEGVAAPTKKCPLCAEEIKAEAIVCRFCGAKFELTERGYCVTDHQVVDLTPEGRCRICGGEVLDRTTQSRLVEENAAAPPPPPPAAAASGFRARFSSEEWSLVMSVPFLFFAMTAGADGTVDEAESGELQRRMQGGALGYKDPLHREVAAEFFSTPVTLNDLLAKANAAGPEKVRETIRGKLTPDEYQGYVGSVFIDTVGVANASGGMSAAETTALTTLATFFGVDLAGIQKRFGS